MIGKSSNSLNTVRGEPDCTVRETLWLILLRYNIIVLCSARNVECLMSWQRAPGLRDREL